MTKILIKSNYSPKEIADDFNNFEFKPKSIGTEQFIEIFNKISLGRSSSSTVFFNLCRAIIGTVPDDIAEAIIEKIGINQTFDICKISPELIDYYIENNPDELFKSFYFKDQNISTEQFKKLVSKFDRTKHMMQLFNSIARTQNVEFIKIIIEANVVNNLSKFKNTVFMYLSGTIIDDEDSIIIFGKVRPEMTMRELKRLSPCLPGMLRTKWVAEFNQVYSWNEFVAKHTLHNIEFLSDIASDFGWVASHVAKKLDF